MSHCLKVIKNAMPGTLTQYVSTRICVAIATFMVLTHTSGVNAQAMTGLEKGKEALTALNHNDLPTAQDAITQALKLAPREAVLWEVKAMIAERLGNTSQATQAYDKAVALGAQSARLSLAQAGFECRQHQALLGERHFREAAEHFSEVAPAALLAAAQCAEQAKQSILAKTDYHRVLALMPNDSDALLGLARIDVNDHQYENAVESLERFFNTNETSNEEALVLMIRVQRALNHTAAALRYEADLMKQFPDSVALKSLNKNGTTP